MLNNKEVSKKLEEVSTKLNETVDLYAKGEIVVEKFINDLWALHYKVNNISYENAETITQDPKLLRISRTLFQEIFKYINQHYSSAKAEENQKDDDHIYF